jgi:hypothetical protein
MTVSGARQGISAIYVDFSSNSACLQRITAPTLNPDGTVSVPVLMFQIASGCKVFGIAVLDGAGDLALYGTEYGAPDPGITIARVPDTTPPVATAASLNPTMVSASTNPAFDTLTVDVDDAVAPVTEISATIFDASGNPVGGGFGGVSSTLTGPVTFSIPLSSLQPGVYTVAFQLIDAGGLASSYGYPNSQPVPGGPLQLTVTA